MTDTLTVPPTALEPLPGQAPPLIDLRSDTVTRPTPAMYERMRTAALGDDGLDGDPTARELEALAARTLGKEAGLYVPTATMGNLLAVLAQVRRQGQVVLESSAHMFLTERGGATLSGTAYVGLAGAAGAMDLTALASALRPSGALPTELVCMETTHVNAGGAALRDAVETMGRTIFSHGVMNWTPTDHNGYTMETGVMLKVVNGAFVVEK